MQYHKTVYQILDILKENNYWYETFEHEPVRTSEQASKLRTGYTLHQGAKSMILRVKDLELGKRFVMLVLPGDMRFDSKKAKQVLNAKDIRLATEEEVYEITKGIEVGGVPPFGNIFGLDVIADPVLFENEKIIFNAGDRRFSVAMNSVDYKEIVKPKILPIVS